MSKEITEEEALKRAEARGLVPLDRFFVVEIDKALSFDRSEYDQYDTKEAADEALAEKGHDFTIVQDRTMIPKEDEA